jgi:hypothetical protein
MVRSGPELMSMRSALGWTGVEMNVNEPQTVQSLIAEREKEFFRELGKNTEIKTTHPLIHMISAHQKLSVADKQSGVMKVRSIRRFCEATLINWSWIRRKQNYTDCKLKNLSLNNTAH